MPPIVTDAGKAALDSFKAGDTIITVLSQQTGMDAKIIR